MGIDTIKGIVIKKIARNSKNLPRILNNSDNSDVKDWLFLKNGEKSLKIKKKNKEQVIWADCIDIYEANCGKAAVRVIMKSLKCNIT